MLLITHLFREVFTGSTLFLSDVEQHGFVWRNQSLNSIPNYFGLLRCLFGSLLMAGRRSVSRILLKFKKSSLFLGSHAFRKTYWISRKINSKFDFFVLHSNLVVEHVFDQRDQLHSFLFLYTWLEKIAMYIPFFATCLIEWHL